MTPTFTVILPTCGRATLSRSIDSVASQLQTGDELLVLHRMAPWGNKARNEAIDGRAAGSHLWFMDDDDMATDNALADIRAGVADDPDRVHLFRMQYRDGQTIWRDPVVRCGNVSTIMMVVPNQPDRLARWGTRYESDFDFLGETLAIRGEIPVWHEEIVGLVRP